MLFAMKLKSKIIPAMLIEAERREVSVCYATKTHDNTVFIRQYFNMGRWYYREQYKVNEFYPKIKNLVY